MINFFYCLCLFGILTVHTANAQVNTDSIANATSSSEGRNRYKELVQKLQRSDSTLNRQDFLTLYYGSTRQPLYQLDLIDSVENSIKEYNLLREFIKAYEFADTLLLFHPVSITAYFEKSFACYALKRSEEESFNKQKYRFFINCVLSSGDGSPETPFVVVSYNDAIEVVKYLQVKYKDIQESDNNTLVVTLLKKYQGRTTLHFRLPTP
jgi:hypothetical protein